MTPVRTITSTEPAERLALALPHEREAVRRAGVALAALRGVRRVVVFGSRVRGDFHGESDLDVLVVVDDIGLKNAVIHELHEIEMDLDVPLAPVIFTTREIGINRALGSPFLDNIDREGIVIHDADIRTEA